MSDRRDTADRRLGPLLVALAALAVLAQLYGLYRSSGPQTLSWFPQADKLAHLVLFAVPVGLILLARGVRTNGASRWAPHRFTASVVVLFLLHAVVSELIQHTFYATRTGDPLDVLADWLGVAVGVALARLLGRPRPRSTPGPGQIIAAHPRLP
ncbi:MAG TPA: VanZ family protein [Propionibacteriaceae bacterium]